MEIIEDCLYSMFCRKVMVGSSLLLFINVCREWKNRKWNAPLQKWNVKNFPLKICVYNKSRVAWTSTENDPHVVHWRLRQIFPFQCLRPHFIKLHKLHQPYNWVRSKCFSKLAYFYIPSSRNMDTLGKWQIMETGRTLRKCLKHSLGAKARPTNVENLTKTESTLPTITIHSV